MKITINCRNLKLSKALESYTYEKFGKLERYVKNLINPGAVIFHVELMIDKSGKEGNRFVCEVTGFAPKAQFRACQAAHEMFVAIDLAQEKLEEQLRKYKEKYITNLENKTKEIFGADQIEETRDLIFEIGKPEIAKNLRKIKNLPSQVRKKRGPELSGMRLGARRKKK